MSYVSFKAKIRPVTVSEFTRHRMLTFHKVDYPWTANETVKATKAYTTDIYDCTAGGIVDSHNNVVMFHICPTQKENSDFDNIEKHIMGMVDEGNNNLSGFLVGSLDLFRDSSMMFKKLHRMLKNHNIPTTILRGTKEQRTDILYNAKKDEWLVTNHNINQKIHNGQNTPETILSDSFDEVILSNKDTLM